MTEVGRPPPRRFFHAPPRPLSGVVCYGPAHANAIIQIGSWTDYGRLFWFSPPVQAEELLSQGWMVKMTWRCPDCVVLDQQSKAK